MPRDPRKFGMSFGKIGEALLKLLQRLGPVQVHFINGLPRKMEMRILKPRNNKATLQIDDCCVRCGEGAYLLIRTYGQNLVAADGEGLRLWSSVIFGPYLSIHEDAIGMLLRRLSRNTNDR